MEENFDLDKFVTEKRMEVVSDPTMCLKKETIDKMNRDELILIINILDKMTSVMAYDIFETHLYKNPCVNDVKKLKIDYIKDTYKNYNKINKKCSCPKQEPVKEEVVKPAETKNSYFYINEELKNKYFSNTTEIKKVEVDEKTEKTNEIIGLFDEIMKS